MSIASNHQNSSSRSPSIHTARWCKPAPRFIKLNVDAAFFPDEGVGATAAAIVRDDRGNFLAAQCKCIPFAADVITTEAMAMRDGLALANFLGFIRVEAESESM